MFSSCSGPGPTFGRCCAHWSLGETRSGRRLPAAPHACECEALDRGNKGSKMRTVSFLVSSSQDMDHAGVWLSVRAVRSAVRGPPTRRWYRVPALLRCSFLVLPVTSDSRVEWGGEMQYGLWRLLSERKKNDKTVRPKLPLWEHFLIVSFQRNFFMLQTWFCSVGLRGTC